MASQSMVIDEVCTPGPVLLRRREPELTLMPQPFYVTFGMGTILRGYYVCVLANSEEIVATWMTRKQKIQYSSIYKVPPANTKPLRLEPEVLYYSKAEHV